MVSEFDIDGNLITHDIVSTNAYTRNLLQDGTVAFVLGHNKGKWPNKFSAVEITIDQISAKNLSHLGRWDGNFSRPTFFEAGGTDFSAAISRQF